MVFDEPSGTLIIFGGWCNRWFNDICTCKVTDVVGPPYNIDTISPIMGPLTGGTHAVIHGIGFLSVKGAAKVRFACMKGHIEVDGDVINDSQLSFRTPDFQKYGAVEVECRIAIGGKALCSDTLAFKYFSVSCATQCIAFGPGLMDGCVPLTSVSFLIEARDDQAIQRACGMDDFLIRVRDRGGFDDEDKFAALLADDQRMKDKENIGINDSGSNVETCETEIQEILHVDLEDLLDGTYKCTYTPQRPALYEISVDFMGSFEAMPGSIRGSPFSVHTCNGDADLNDFDGPLVIGRLNENTKKLKDFCNDLLKGLRSVPDPASRDALVFVKEHLRSVETRSDELALTIDATRAALKYLKTIGSAVDRMIDALAGAEALWQEVLEQVYCYFSD